MGGKPSLMTFREVETLFHEFGHALQHMLTAVEDGMVSGIRCAWVGGVGGVVGGGGGSGGGGGVWEGVLAVVRGRGAGLQRSALYRGQLPAARGLLQGAPTSGAWLGRT